MAARKSRNSLYLALLRASAATVLGSTGLAASPVLAQPLSQPDKPDSDTDEEEVILVTGSRVERAGFEAPTPTTVVSSEDLQAVGRTDIGSALNDLPQFRATTTPATTTTLVQSGLSIADLRGLGSSRTLVLVDSRRPVYTTTGGFSLNMLPFLLVDRVEVVTGGASAAWGSGAVSGVVNLIPDSKLNGLRTNVQYGVTTRGDGTEYQLGAAFGSPFAGGRGHFLVGAEYVKHEGIRPRTARPWLGKWALIANPAFTPTNGQPQFVIAPDVNYSNASLGGLITTGPLADIEFGPGGEPRRFVFGTLRGTQFMSGGGGIHNNDFIPLLAPLDRKNAYARITYKLAETLRFKGDLLYSRSRTDSDLFPDNNLGNLTIGINNAFMPASIRAQLQALGQTSIRVGRVNRDFGFIHSDGRYTTTQATFGFEGDLGGGWSWDGYYSYGKTRSYNALENGRVASLFADSLDSVISPTTGQPICRSALTVPTTACVPVNLFGFGAPSQAALDYFQDDALAISHIRQHVAAASLHGEPFRTWAGPVSLAFGGEWRKEETWGSVDQLSAQGRFAGLNFSVPEGGYSVKEVFAETVIPLADNLAFARTLEVNGAVRLSDYSTSGSITSWKAGLNWEPIDGLRFRATRSRDIRAPNLEELYTVNGLLLTNITDPQTRVQAQASVITGGNPNLLPEKADTWTAGVVLRPSWLPGLALSVDYYDINIGGAIVRSAGQDIVNRCFQGNTALCPLITRNAAGVITTVQSPFINLTSYETNGVDLELAYRTSLAGMSLPGRLDFRLIANYVDKLITDDGRTRVDTAGDLGASATLGVPHWRGAASLGYEEAGFGANLRARYVQGGAYNHLQTIDDNKVGSRLYFDLGLQFALDSRQPDRITFYVNAINLFDKDPPKLPSVVHFDVIGRAFNVGVRTRF